MAVDRNFPLRVCNHRWYFSYDTDVNHELPPILASLRSPPVLISRGNASAGGPAAGWVAAMRRDLAAVAEPYLFHIMDDDALPVPISPVAVEAVVRLAAHLGAATVGLNRPMVGYWRTDPAVSRLGEGTLPSLIAANLPGAVWKASGSTRFAVQQSFALWSTSALLATMAPFGGQSTPADWEQGWNNWGWRDRTGRNAAHAPNAAHSPNASHAWLRASAYAIDFDDARRSGLEVVADVGHRGLIKAGWAACCWVHQATRLSLRGDSHSVARLGLRAVQEGQGTPTQCKVAEGHTFLSNPAYAMCRHVPLGATGTVHRQPRCNCDLCKRCHCHNPDGAPPSIYTYLPSRNHLAGQRKRRKINLNA